MCEWQNNQNVVVVESYFLGDKQQASRANCDVQHGCAHKVARYSSGKRSSIILKGCFLNQYPWEFSIHRNTVSTSGTYKFFITYHYICTLNEEPTGPGKSLLGLSNLFFTWNFLDRLKQTFLQINLFVAWKYRAWQSPSKFGDDWLICRKLRSVLAS